MRTNDISTTIMKPNRREKFIELAEKRVNKAIRNINLIGNLSNKSNYSYTEQDVKKIVAALRSAVEEIRGRFDRKLEGNQSQFKL